MDLTGEAVELGVQNGFFSKVILEKWNGAKLHMVDIWPTGKTPQVMYAFQNSLNVAA